jgi:glycosyltransferase involved in cell wall biosynthesis
LNNTEVDSKVEFSICICNYNMADTIKQSLMSILDQVDVSFEVLIVDDGSSDNSVNIVKELQLKHHNLRLIQLKRDPDRRLGFTRNISIQEARGNNVILHLDCDDIIGPYIKDFTTLFSKIENAVGRHILLSGHHINVANRQFLLDYGPYKNIYRGEDRELWRRLAVKNEYIILNHIDFIKRLPKTKKKRIKISIYNTFDHMVTDFRFGMSLVQYFKLDLKKRKKFSHKVVALRLFLIVPSWLFSLTKEKILQTDTINDFDKLIEYRIKWSGTYQELMLSFGSVTDDTLSNDTAKKVFFIK